MNDQWHREAAIEIMLTQARHTDLLTIVERANDDAEAIAELIRTANIEITWVGDEPKLNEWQRDILAQVAAGTPSQTVEQPEYLTAVQDIRLRVFESLTNERTETDEIRDILAMVVQAGRVIETGELDDLEDACGEGCPGRDDDDVRRSLRAKVDLCERRLAHVGWVLGLIGEGLPPGDERQLREALEWTPEPQPECTCAQVDVSTHGQPNLTTRGRPDPNCPVDGGETHYFGAAPAQEAPDA